VVQVVLRLAALRFAHVVPRRILQPGLDLKNWDYRQNLALMTKNHFLLVVIFARQVDAECTPEFCFRPKSSGINWHHVSNDTFIHKNPALDMKEEKIGRSIIFAVLGIRSFPRPPVAEIGKASVVPATSKESLTERGRYIPMLSVGRLGGGGVGANSCDGREAGISQNTKNYSEDCAHQGENCDEHMRKLVLIFAYL
jgi:hypothetical protein